MNSGDLEVSLLFRKKLNGTVRLLNKLNNPMMK